MKTLDASLKLVEPGGVQKAMPFSPVVTQQRVFARAGEITFIAHKFMWISRDGARKYRSESVKARQRAIRTVELMATTAE